MRTSSIHFLVVVIVCVLCATATMQAGEFEDARLQNWHQWRGPDATGVAPEADPPTEWSEDKNVQWKIAVPGKGSSTPIIWGDRVFIQTAVETDRKEEKPPAEIAEAPGGNPFRVQRPDHYHKFIVMCYDRANGEVLWEQVSAELVPHEGAHHDHGFASSSPVTDGKFVYSSFGSRGIYCYDMEGNLEWERDLGDAIIYRFFGEASSPVLHGDTLIVNWDNEENSFLIALDAATGDTKWKKERPEHSSWATPLVVEHEGTTQIVVNGNIKARSYDFETGDVLWECGGQTLAIIPTPVATDELAFLMSGYPGSSLIAVPLGARGDVTDTDKIAWKRDQDTPYVPSPLLYGDRLWLSKSNQAVLSCLDAATGEEIIGRQRMSGLSTIYASPVGAADRIYFTGRDGTTLVVANDTEYRVLATNRLDDSIDASPALVGNQIFLRGKKNLYCIAAD